MTKVVIDGPRQWLHEKPLYPKESETAGISFNKTFLSTDFSAAVSGVHTLSILASEHGMAGNVPVRIFDTDSRLTNIDYIVDVSGNIYIEVTEVPDYRFSGSIHMGV